MGNVVTTNILSTVAAMGLATLREQIVLARLVNREYEGQMVGARLGSTVNVVIPAAVAVNAVTAANYPPVVASQTPTVRPITLNQHYEAPFVMTDYDLAKVDRGIIPMQVKEAARAIANYIDAYLFTVANVFGYTGTAGTTPFGTDLSAFTAARGIANKSLMPMDNRFMLLSPDAETNALGLRAIQDASFRGSNEGIVKGQIGEILGATWAMSQNVPTHTNGYAGTPLLNDSAARAVGTTSLNIDGFTTKPSPGDIFTIAGDTQTYAVQSAGTLSGTNSLVVFEPGLKVAIPAVDGNEVVTFKASHVKNLLIHRDTVSFAMAPLANEAEIAPNLVNMAVVIDEMSGLALRLEVTREHRQFKWSFDALYGACLTRPEFGVVIAG